MTFGTEAKVIEVAAQNWNPGGEVEQAGASLLGFLQALATAGIWFGIVWLPILLVFGIVAGLILLVARRMGWLRRPIPPGPDATAATGRRRRMMLRHAGAAMRPHGTIPR